MSWESATRQFSLSAGVHWRLPEQRRNGIWSTRHDPGYVRAVDSHEASLDQIAELIASSCGAIAA
jgi:hypothetical protein